jgi:predicted RNA-binding protein associated with RNAse of E/G family
MDTLTTTTVSTEALVLIAAREAIDAKDAKRVAEEGWKATEAHVMDVFVTNGVTTILVPEVDGTNTRVTLEGLDEVRRTVDYTALAELVTPEVLASVTKSVLDADKFAAAVEMGLIPAKVAEMVTTVKAVKPSVKVTAKAKS